VVSRGIIMWRLDIYLGKKRESLRFCLVAAILGEDFYTNVLIKKKQYETTTSTSLLKRKTALHAHSLRPSTNGHFLTNKPEQTNAVHMKIQTYTGNYSNHNLNVIKIGKKLLCSGVLAACRVV